MHVKVAYAEIGIHKNLSKQIFVEFRQLLGEKTCKAII